MDNDPKVTEQPTPVEPEAVVAPTETVSTPPTGGGGNKIMLWLILGLVIIILVMGGLYLYMKRQQASQTTQQTVTQSAVSPSPQAQENLENDLNTADSGDPTKAFTSVDQDLQSL